MKILITGANSYIGNNIRRWLEKNKMEVYELETRSSAYQNFDYSSYDSVIHVAAIVHKKEGKISWQEYHQVNTLLPLKIANLAKSQGVSQFIFFSTMGVYGQDKALPQGNIIDGELLPKALNDYGKSKYEAELGLQALENEQFKLVIIRPPSIYGPDCPGNYINSFVKMADLLPIFPDIYRESQQSFLFIDNLCEFILLLIQNKACGIYMPQDEKTLSTVELLQIIAHHRGKRIIFTKLFNPMIRLISGLTIVKKLFGGVSYQLSMSNYFDNAYQLHSPEKAFKYLAFSED